MTAISKDNKADTENQYNNNKIRTGSYENPATTGRYIGKEGPKKP